MVWKRADPGYCLPAACYFKSAGLVGKFVEQALDHRAT